MQKFKETRDSGNIYQNELDKTCCQHANGDFKDLPRRIIADRLLHDKVFDIAKNPKMDGYNEDLLQWLINF